MNRRRFVGAVCAGTVGLLAAPRLRAQARSERPALAELAAAHGLVLINRTATPLVEGDRQGLRLNEGRAEGFVLLPGTAFSHGTIDLDLRGRDVADRSLLGVAFHVDDATTFDAIFFRPFNFRASDPEAAAQAVQYYSPPRDTWQKLRDEQPGKYETRITPPPDPNDWFHARIEVASGRARVFVGAATAPCLDIALLNTRESGFVALWVGNDSGGDFANLTIVPAGGQA